jgi:hypothetical protein
MSDDNWISVGEYQSGISAGIASNRLNIDGVPNRTAHGLRDPTWYIWVPPEWVEKAKQLLAKEVVDEDALTALALQYPPPDDA